MLNNYLCDIVLSFWDIFEEGKKHKRKAEFIFFILQFLFLIN